MQITEKVLWYQQGHWTWTDLWRHLRRVIDQFLAMTTLDDDQQVRFLNKFEPRLIGMIESFEYRGITFEALLRRSMRMQLNTIYAETKREKAHFAYFAKGNEADQSADLVSDSSTQSDWKHSGSKRFHAMPVGDRRILIAAFKNCLHLDAELCSELARHFDISLDWILDCRDQLVDSLENRLALHRKLRQQINLLKMEPNAVKDSRQIRDQLKEERRKARIERLQERLCKQSVTPHHHDIARILGIPKGSVDSSLFYLRRTLQLPIDETPA